MPDDRERIPKTLLVHLTRLHMMRQMEIISDN